MGLYNDRNDVFGVTSLGVFHARLPWPLPNIIYVDVAVASLWPICLNANSDHISPHLLLFPSLPFPFPPLSSSPCKYHLFWRFLSCSSSPLCRFFRSFQLLSGRFSMSALWWQWSLDWNCKLYFFLPFFWVAALFRCVIVARVFRFFSSFSKQEFTHTIYVNIWTHLHRSAYEFVWNTINGL